MNIYTVTDWDGNRYEVAADSADSAVNIVEATEGVTCVCVEYCSGVC